MRLLGCVNNLILNFHIRKYKEITKNLTAHIEAVHAVQSKIQSYVNVRRMNLDRPFQYRHQPTRCIYVSSFLSFGIILARMRQKKIPIQD